MKRFVWLFLWLLVLGIFVIIGVYVGNYANENLVQPWVRWSVVIIIAGIISLLGHVIAFIVLAPFFVDKLTIFTNNTCSEST